MCGGAGITVKSSRFVLLRNWNLDKMDQIRNLKPHKGWSSLYPTLEYHTIKLLEYDTSPAQYKCRYTLLVLCSLCRLES